MRHNGFVDSMFVSCAPFCNLGTFRDIRGFQSWGIDEVELFDIYALLAEFFIYLRKDSI